MFKLKHPLALCSKYYQRTNTLVSRPFSSGRSAIDYNDTPIKFSTSEAREYKAKVSRVGWENTRPWYEPYVILGSITVFLLYFCWFREENDIDKELSQTLYSRIDGLEETQLRLTMKYNLDNGVDTTAIAKRLDEIEEQSKEVVI